MHEWILSAFPERRQVKIKIFKPGKRRKNILPCYEAYNISFMQEKKLNLGSGEFPKTGFVNVDYFARIKPDVIHDLNVFPYPFQDNEFDFIEARHVLEHLKDPFGVMRELHRITKPGGKILIKVPHFSRGFAHPEHTRGFDVYFPFFFNPEFSGGYQGVHFNVLKLKLRWFAQRHLKRKTLSVFTYAFGVSLSTFFDFFARLSPFFCSRLWCFWVGGFEEVSFTFQPVKD